MKAKLPLLASSLLGLAFITFGANFFLNFLPSPGQPPAGSPPALFFAAIAPTGYLGFVKTLEILGGALVAIPKTRNLGLLVLGPILVNILCFKIFLTKGAGLADPVLILLCSLALYLLIDARKKFSALIH